MAMLECTECSKEISMDAMNCPKCGTNNPFDAYGMCQQLKKEIRWGEYDIDKEMNFFTSSFNLFNKRNIFIYAILFSIVGVIISTMMLKTEPEFSSPLPWAKNLVEGMNWVKNLVEKIDIETFTIFISNGVIIFLIIIMIFFIKSFVKTLVVRPKISSPGYIVWNYNATIDKNFERKLTDGLNQEALDSCSEVSSYLNKKASLISKYSKKSTFKFIIGKWYYFVSNFIMINLLGGILHMNIKWYKAHAYIFSEKLDITLLELIVGELSLIILLSVILQAVALDGYKNWIDNIYYRLTDLSSYLDDTFTNTKEV